MTTMWRLKACSHCRGGDLAVMCPRGDVPKTIPYAA